MKISSMTINTMDAAIPLAQSRVGLIPDSLLSYEKALNVDLIYYISQLKLHQSRNENYDPGEYDNLKDKIFFLNRRKDSLIQALEKNYPEYYQLKYQSDIAPIE